MNNFLKMWLRIFLTLILLIGALFIPIFISGLFRNMNFMFLELLTVPTGIVAIIKLHDLFDE